MLEGQAAVAEGVAEVTQEPVVVVAQRPGLVAVADRVHRPPVVRPHLPAAHARAPA